MTEMTTCIQKWPRPPRNRTNTQNLQKKQNSIKKQKFNQKTKPSIGQPTPNPATFGQPQNPAIWSTHTKPSHLVNPHQTPIWSISWNYGGQQNMRLGVKSLQKRSSISTLLCVIVRKNPSAAASKLNELNIHTDHDNITSTSTRQAKRQKKQSRNLTRPSSPYDLFN